MIRIREAKEGDVEAIREIFQASYGDSYAYPEFYETGGLKKMVFEDDTVMFVAEDEDSGHVLGTASVIVDIAAYGDLMGEFGRLVVHPDARNRGVGNLLMGERIRQVEDRLHIGIVENRVAHPFSQMISDKFGFSAAGFLPRKLLFEERESTALFVQHFGSALELRRNHPRVIPEAFALSEIVLGNCGLEPDAIVDDESGAYPHEEEFEIEELTTDGYTRLLRLERGRLEHREIFGPVRLHAGMFQLRAGHAHYLLARKDGVLAGGVGFIIDRHEDTLRIFEVVSVDGAPVHFLIREVVRRAETEWKLGYFEVDVSAYAPEMQRTLLECGFLPVGYLPATVFHKVERLDGIKMARLTGAFSLEEVALHESTQRVADAVLPSFFARNVSAHLLQGLSATALFRELNEDQIRRVGAVAEIVQFPSGGIIFEEGDVGDQLWVVLSGSVGISTGVERREVGKVAAGETLGEQGLSGTYRHSATATALQDVEVVAFAGENVRQVFRLHPDIGLRVYRNLSAGLSQRLRRLDEDLSG